MGFRTGWLVAGGCAALLLVAPGCRTPQPRTWWGVRHVLGEGEENGIEQPNQPRTASGARVGAQGGPPPAGEGVPQDSEYAQAVRLVRDQQYEQARQVLYRVVERNPRNAEAHRWLGDCHYNLMDLERAIESYEQALNLDPQNYYALRGKGFAHLHLGHQFWKRADQEANPDLRTRAHEHYKLSLDILRQCLDLYPSDSEAMYGRAMAAEGASRLLYATAVEYRQTGRSTDAEYVRGRTVQIIDEGIAAADQRIAARQLDKGPRLLQGGLLLRRAMLFHLFGETRQAMQDLQRSIQVQETILNEIDPRDPDARQMLEQNRARLNEWQAAGS